MRSLSIALAALIALPLAAQAPSRRAPQDLLEQFRDELRAARQDIEDLRNASVPERKLVSGSLGVDFTTEYLFRGIAQEDQDLIAQPSLELAFRTYETPAKDVTLDVTLGTWNSLHGGPTKRDGSAWYEDDVYGGFSCAYAQRLLVGARYTAYHSPNGSFDTVHEVALSASWDDSGLLWQGGFRPAATLAFECSGQADAGRRRGSVAEVGMKPFQPLGSLGACAFELLVPVRIGVGIYDYYELPGGGGDDGIAFGYLDVGIALAVAQPLATALQSFRVEAGVHYVRLGDANATRNGGEADELIGTLGFVTNF